MALLSTASGFVEAGFLVTTTRAAFAVAGGESTVRIVEGTTTTIPPLIALAVLLVAVRLALSSASAWLSARLTMQFEASLRRRLSMAYLHATWPAQQDEQGGRFQELLTTFANRGAHLMSALAQVVIASCTLAALLVMALTIDPLSSVAVAIAVVLLANALRPIRAAARRQAVATVAIGMSFATTLEEISQLGTDMHTFNVQPALRAKVESLIDDNESTNRRLNFINGMVPAVYSSLAYLALLAALAAATLSSSSNIESVGTVVLVMLRSLTYGQAFQVHMAAVHSGLPFLESVNCEIDRFSNGSQKEGVDPVGNIGHIRMESVSFHYDEPDRPTLCDINLEIAPGELIGVVGPSGSGKSTLIQLLLGLRAPTEGRILFEGRPIDRFDRAEWCRKVGHVSQQPRLVSGSIAENVAFMREWIGKEEIERALRIAQLHNDVIAFPGGYDHQVGERGNHLSGGQQQRLIIARALAGDPELLILDEPTSALDVRSESLIRESLAGLKGKVTTIIIAHRLSTLDICDRIMVIQGGQLMAFDAPTELERSSRFYRDALRLSELH